MSGNRLFSVTDTSGYNANLTGTPTILATSPTNTIFRGVALTPQNLENQVTSISVSPVAQSEGNSGSTTYTFTVTRAGGTTGALSFTANFGALDTDAADFVGGTLPGIVNGTILAGQTSATFTVNVAGDTTVENNENFTYTLASVSNSSASPSIDTATATATITNDDTAPLPNLTINDVTAVEGNSGTTTFRFTVTLSAPAPAGGVTFDIATANGTAIAGSDYVPRTLTSQTIAAGSTTYTFDVTVNGDTTFEPNENFFVNVTNVVGATVLDGQGQGTINNDDLAPAPTLVSSTPLDNATDVAIGANIVLNFDQSVFMQTGNVILRPATGADITIPISDPQITFSGSTVTINPTADLRPGVAYDVIIGSNVIINGQGTNFGGIALDALDFTTSFAIPGGSQATTFTIADPGTFTLANGTTRTQTALGGVSVTATTGPVNVTINGTLNDTATTQRTINCPSSEHLAQLAA